MNKQILNKVIVDVIEERERQNGLWGVQRHDYNWWMNILMEEVGEAAKEVNNWNFNTSPVPGHEEDAEKKILSDLKEEMIQVAAVAVAIVEHLEEEGY